MIRGVVIFLSVLIIACKSSSQDSPISELFKPGVSTGTLEGRKAREASGLIASINNPGMLWTHNDSGNAAEIFLIDTTGRIHCTVSLKDSKNRDWEDIAIDVGADARAYLYVGDIGDNNAMYDQKFLYRIEEPVIPSMVSDTLIEQVDKIEFRLSDGARDTEALMIDPITHNFYIFSKREQRVNLYKLQLSSAQGSHVAERVLENLPFTMIVGGDIARDGTEILAKNYDNIFYWKRNASESIEDAVKRSAERLPYEPEPQGEAIAFNRNGTGFFTLSEQKKKQAQQLLFYSRK